MTESTKELGTREKSSQAPFAHAAYCEPSVGRLLVTPGFRLFSGCCGTWFARLYKESYTRANLQTVLTQWPENSRPCVGFLTWLKLLALAAKSQTSLDFARLRVTFHRWRGITFAKNSHWCISQILSRTQASLAFHSLNHIFPCAGAFRSFDRQKNMKERLEENSSE